MGKRYLAEEMDNLSLDELVDMGAIVVDIEDGLHDAEEELEDPLSCPELQLDLFPTEIINDD